MNLNFISPQLAGCVIRLWASRRHGFSLPKRIEITYPTGDTAVFVHRNRAIGFAAELTDVELVRIAVAQYLQRIGEANRSAILELDVEVTPFQGELKRIPVTPESSRSSRVRPGRPVSLQIADMATINAAQRGPGVSTRRGNDA